MRKTPLEFVDLYSVEFFEHTLPELSVVDYEWLIKNGNKKLNDLLMDMVHQRLGNSRLRVWWQQVSKHISLENDRSPKYEDWKFILAHLPTRSTEFDLRELFATTIHCRICDQLLWSGLTVKRFMTDDIRRLVTLHGHHHIVDAVHVMTPMDKLQRDYAVKKASVG